MTVHRWLSGKTAPSLAVAVAALVLAGSEALARPSVGVADGVGYDVSYPQCGRPLPAGPAFAIVGVNGGRPFSANPCLAEELAWAGVDAEFIVLAAHVVHEGVTVPDQPGE